MKSSIIVTLKQDNYNFDHERERVQERVRERETEREIERDRETERMFLTGPYSLSLVLSHSFIIMIILGSPQ